MKMKERVREMLAEERFREILKIVNEKKTVTVTELTELLDTSESTIRRDLTQLHKRGALLKVHGGATVLNGAYTTKDAKVSEREGLYVEEKRSIAKLAAALIGQEDFVYIDAGTSTASLAEAISERGRVCDEWNSACKVSGRKRLPGVFAGRRAERGYTGFSRRSCGRVAE